MSINKFRDDLISSQMQADTLEALLTSFAIVLSL